MGKLRNRKDFWKKTVLVFATAILCLLPVDIAYANSAPPPSVVWLTFDYKTAQPPQLLGIQLIACMTADCELSVLLQQYGTCDGVGCAKLPLIQSDRPSEFVCAANICRSAVSPTHGGTDFKLVVQFSDRVRSSDVISKLPSSYAEAKAWHVIVRETDLVIVLDTATPARHNPLKLFSNNFWWIGLSIAVELLVASLCFQIWARTDIRRLMGRLLIIFLVNLVSLPVVWLFFPSLGKFQSGGSRGLGIFVLVAAIIFAVLLAGIYRSENKTRRRMIILTIISLPGILFCYLALSFVTGFGSSSITIQGLPFDLAIIAAEVFAVVFEAILVTILSKRSIPLRLIWVTSLLMNSASFISGQVLTGTLESIPLLFPNKIDSSVPLATPLTSAATPISTIMVEPNVWISLGLEKGDISALVIDPKTPTTLYVAASFGNVVNGVLKSADGGKNWMLISSDRDVISLVIDPVTPTTLYAVTRWDGVFKSTDGGENWNPANTGFTQVRVGNLAIDPLTPTTLYVDTYGGIFKSTDGGGNWIALHADLESAIYALEVDPKTPTTLYAGTSHGVFKSTDGGKNWKTINTGLPSGKTSGTISTLVINPTTPNILYAGTFGSGLFISTNGGKNWINTGLIHSFVYALVIDPLTPTNLYAGADEGMFKSTDGGKNWSTINTGLTDTGVFALAIDPLTPTILYAGTTKGVFVIRQGK